MRENEIQRLPFPRACWSRRKWNDAQGVQSLGERSKRDTGSAEALLRRVGGWKRLPQINAVVDVINLVSWKAGCRLGCTISGTLSVKFFSRGARRRNVQGNREIRFEFGRTAVVCDTVGPHGSATMIGTNDGDSRDDQVLAVIISLRHGRTRPRAQRMSALLKQYAADKTWKLELSRKFTAIRGVRRRDFLHLCRMHLEAAPIIGSTMARLMRVRAMKRLGRRDQLVRQKSGRCLQSDVLKTVPLLRCSMKTRRRCWQGKSS